ncbi:MAG: flavodoxin domain-containing protein [Proteobacteria bacterium]|nr:flavodoxin domain-containing protein [Pseudomonadota bacterium]
MLKIKKILIAGIIVLLAGQASFAGSVDMNEKGKILVVYATKSGSTAEVAQAIAEEFRAQNAVVDVFEVKKASQPEGYTAVVVGSAIRYGRWLPDAIKYLKTHKDQLSRIPIAYFNCGIFLVQGKPGQKEEAKKYNAPAEEIVKPVAEIGFGGKLDFGKLNFWERQLGKIVGIPAGDYRDFNVIRAWAREIFPKLSKGQVRP